MGTEVSVSTLTIHKSSRDEFYSKSFKTRSSFWEDLNDRVRTRIVSPTETPHSVVTPVSSPVSYELFRLGVTNDTVDIKCHVSFRRKINR